MKLLGIASGSIAAISSFVLAAILGANWSTTSIVSGILLALSFPVSLYVATWEEKNKCN
jgi:hypothetical protein